MAVPTDSPSRVAPPIGHAIPDMPIVVEPPTSPALPAGGTMGLPAGERRPGLIGRFLRSLLGR